MITGRDLTPEQRAKAFRAYRFSAITNLIYGMLFLGLSVFVLFKGRRTWFFYWMLAFGLVLLWMSWVSWARAGKYGA